MTQFTEVIGNRIAQTHTRTSTHTCVLLSLPRQQFSRWLVSSHFLLWKGKRAFSKVFHFSFSCCRFFLLACWKKGGKINEPKPNVTYPAQTTRGSSRGSSCSSSCLPSSLYPPHMLLPSPAACCRLAALFEFNKWNSLNFIHINPLPFVHPLPLQLPACQPLCANNFQFSISRDFRLINSIGKVFQKCELQLKLKASLHAASFRPASPPAFPPACCNLLLPIGSCNWQWARHKSYRCRFAVPATLLITN